MASTQDAFKHVVAIGDVTMDWHLARSRHGSSDSASWTADDCTSASQQRGGVALLIEVIEALAPLMQQKVERRIACFRRERLAAQGAPPIATSITTKRRWVLSRDK
jgi:hypothetical protein